MLSPLKDPPPYGDMDIYGIVPYLYSESTMIDLLCSTNGGPGYKFHRESPYAYTLIKDNHPTIQVIRQGKKTKAQRTISAILSSFDLGICCAAYDPYDGWGYTAPFWEKEETQKIIKVKNKHNLLDHRISAYIRKGFTISEEDAKKFEFTYTDELYPESDETYNPDEATPVTLRRLETVEETLHRMAQAHNTYREARERAGVRIVDNPTTPVDPVNPYTYTWTSSVTTGTNTFFTQLANSPYVVDSIPAFYEAVHQTPNSERTEPCMSSTAADTGQPSTAPENASSQPSGEGGASNP